MHPFHEQAEQATPHMPLSSLLSIPAPTLQTLAGLTADQIRVVVDAYPVPGVREFRLVAPNGLALVKVEMLATLTTPELLARFAELRYRLPLEVFAPEGQPTHERHLQLRRT